MHLRLPFEVVFWNFVLFFFQTHQIATVMKQHQNYFDVIIVDASDPVGPADVLFEKPFYMAMKSALRSGGIVATQGENMWLHLDLIGNVLRFCREGGSALNFLLFVFGFFFFCFSVFCFFVCLLFLFFFVV